MRKSLNWNARKVGYTKLENGLKQYYRANPPIPDITGWTYVYDFFDFHTEDEPPEAKNITSAYLPFEYKGIYSIICKIKNLKSNKITYIEKLQKVDEYFAAAQTQWIKLQVPFDTPKKFQQLLSPEARLSQQSEMIDFWLALQDGKECARNYAMRAKMVHDALRYIKDSYIFLSQLDTYYVRNGELKVDTFVSLTYERIYFVAMYISDPKRTGHTGFIPLQVFLQQIGVEQWQVVDWTGPTADFRGVYTGEKRDTREEAINSALKAWENSNKYLPHGHVYYKLNMLSETKRFETKLDFLKALHSILFEVAFWAGIVGLGLGFGSILFATRALGFFVSCLIYTSIGAGSAAAAISLYDRANRQVNTQMDEAFLDLLVIGSGLLWGSWALIGRINLTKSIALRQSNGALAEAQEGSYVVVAANADELAMTLRSLSSKLTEDIKKLKDEVDLLGRQIRSLTKIEAAFGTGALASDAMIVIMISQKLWNEMLDDKKSEDLTDMGKIESIMSRMGSAAHTMLLVSGVILMPAQAKQFLSQLTKSHPLLKSPMLGESEFVAPGLNEDLFIKFDVEAFENPSYFIEGRHFPEQEAASISNFSIENPFISESLAVRKKSYKVEFEVPALKTLLGSGSSNEGMLFSVVDRLETAGYSRKRLLAIDVKTLDLLEQALKALIVNQKYITKRIVARLMKFSKQDAELMRKLAKEHGEEVLTQIKYYPIDDIKILDKYLDRLKKRILNPVSGLYDSIKRSTENSLSEGWEVYNYNRTDHNGTTLISEISGPEGSSGDFSRTYNPSSKQLTMESAFLEDLPTWIQHEPNLLQGKGVPTVTYFTIYQMCELNIPYGSLELVKMSTIQNIDTILHLDWLIRKHPEASQDELILYTHSVKYAETPIIQSGHKIVSAEIDSSTAWERNQPIGELMEFYEMRGVSTEYHDNMLTKYGLSRDDTPLINFNIYLQIEKLR